MAAEPEVIRHENAASLADDVATRTVRHLAGAVDALGVAHLVVTGGGILEQVLGALAEPARRDALDWGAVHVWWGDERWVPADSDDRNDRPAMSLLFDRVPVDPAKVHRMPASDAGFDSAEAAADAYAAELAEHSTDGEVPAFDVVLLGVGPDGHCASLFPGHPGTQVRDRSVIAVHDSPKPPPDRLSLTFPTLDAGDEVWFVASGSGKAHAVAMANAATDALNVPSSAVRGLSHTVWLVDTDAAADLAT